MSSARRAVPTAGAWAALLNAPAVAARELARAELPNVPGVYLWKRDGEPVYVGMATSLRGCAGGKHLGGGVSLAGSSLRRNVCELLFGIPPNVTGRPTRQKVTTEQAAAVRNWLLGCELSWLEVPSVAAADELERRLRREWMPVADIFDAADPAAMMQLPAKYEVGNDATAVQIVGKLWQEVHHNQSLHFYEETDQDIERVLDIFVRVNSGGTVLSYSDLLMSIATAQWKEKDARAAVHDLVDALNTTGQGFDFSQDTVLKSGLVLADVGDVGFKVRNFTTANMATLEARWDDISTSLRIAAELLADFGLSGGTLTADSVLIPVAYYVHRRGLTPSYRVSDKYAMARRGKPLEVTDALIEDILSLAYGGGRTWAVLATLFDHVDTRMQYHEDHVFPKSQLDARALKAAKHPDGSRRYSDDAIDELVRRRDLMPNLELLPGPENVGKSDTAPYVWTADHYPGADEYAAFLKANALPGVLPHGVDDFLDFYDARRELLIARIKEKLRTQVATVPPVEVAPASTDIDAELGEGDLDD